MKKMLILLLFQVNHNQMQMMVMDNIHQEREIMNQDNTQAKMLMDIIQTINFKNNK